ncbi:hypothetical protein A6A26_04075 [Pantoea sp. OXWO6B1]|nr:hypothetical protein A6A26_04075 [Pantoea sp. OXWO6B1]
MLLQIRRKKRNGLIVNGLAARFSSYSMILPSVVYLRNIFTQSVFSIQMHDKQIFNIQIALQAN